MTIQNDPNSKVILAPTSHLVVEEFDGVTISFKLNDSFVHVESHAMEVPIIEIYAPGCDPEYDDIDEASFPSICLLCEDVAYEACKSFKETGAIPEAIECQALKGIFKFRAKLPYDNGLLIYMYGFDMADGEWENTALCVIYPKEYEGTDDEKHLIAALDEAARSYKENKKMKQLLERVITANGINKQLDVAIEELSELLQAICKIKRREPDECLNEDYLINLAEEMADVEIILAELKLLFDNEDNVKEWKNYKLDRLEKRLNEKYSFETMSGVYDLSE